MYSAKQHIHLFDSKEIWLTRLEKIENVQGKATIVRLLELETGFEIFEMNSDMDKLFHEKSRNLYRLKRHEKTRKGSTKFLAHEQMLCETNTVMTFLTNHFQPPLQKSRDRT
jgi:hypothetical protein